MFSSIKARVLNFVNRSQWHWFISMYFSSLMVMLLTYASLRLLVMLLKSSI